MVGRDAVGEFKQLVELSTTDPGFNEKLKQYLIPNKAREHAAQAVENDRRLRMWGPEPDNMQGGLLYRTTRAAVDLDRPQGACSATCDKVSQDTSACREHEPA